MHKIRLCCGLAAALLFSAFLSNCSKIDTTSLGSDLIPAVDNINTFADTLDVETSTSFMDTSMTKVTSDDLNALGKINNDPLFGKTTANLFLQFIPNTTTYPYHLGSSSDTLKAIDSVVLCLSYAGIYGDSTKPQTFDISEIRDDFFRDSFYVKNNVGWEPVTQPAFTRVTVDPAKARNWQFFNYGKDSVQNQIRIKVADANTNPFFVQRLFNLDKASAIVSDTFFRANFHGLGIRSVGISSNSLMYTSLVDAKTRLEIYYRKTAAGATKQDTTATTWGLLSVNSSYTSGRRPSATANSIVRDYTGTAVGNSNAQYAYLQTGPGTYVNIKVKGLDTLSNRIIHRAYLEVTQAPDNFATDSMFYPVPYVYLDLKDTSAGTKYKPLYFDLNSSSFYNPDVASGIPPSYLPYDYSNNLSVNFGSFGGVVRTKAGTGGQPVKYYNLNMTRYVQHVVKDALSVYEMRLWAPFTIRYPEKNQAYIPYYNNVAVGRTRVAGGSNTDRASRMKMIIVWSKI